MPSLDLQQGGPTFLQEIPFLLQEGFGYLGLVVLHKVVFTIQAPLVSL